MKALLLTSLLLAGFAGRAADTFATHSGVASWYGEQHRGRLMANGKPFDPDKLTAASWSYPLGARVCVRLDEPGATRSVLVTITDRGPHRRLVDRGRIIDLGRAAFQRLAHVDRGLIRVRVEPAEAEGPEAGREHHSPAQAVRADLDKSPDQRVTEPPRGGAWEESG